MRSLAMAAFVAALTFTPATARWVSVVEDEFSGRVYYSSTEEVDDESVELYVREHPEWGLEIFVSTEIEFCPLSAEHLGVTEDDFFVYVDVVIDGKRLEESTLMGLAEDNDGIFFNNDPKIWIERVNKGDRMFVRVEDGCGKLNTYEFDISARTQFQ